MTAKCGQCNAALKDASVLRQAAKIVRDRTPRKSFLTEVIARVLESLAVKLDQG